MPSNVVAFFGQKCVDQTPLPCKRPSGFGRADPVRGTCVKAVGHAIRPCRVTLDYLLFLLAKVRPPRSKSRGRLVPTTEMHKIGDSNRLHTFVRRPLVRICSFNFSSVVGFSG